MSQRAEQKNSERVEKLRDKPLEKVLPASREIGNNFKILGLKPEEGRWLFVIIGMIINLCLGSIYSWSIFKAQLKAVLESYSYYELSALDLMWPFLIFLACFAISMPLAGGYIEKYGPRKTVMVGGALTGLGWIMTSIASSIKMVIVGYGIVGGVGVGIIYGVPIAMAVRWFPDRRGLAVGLTVFGFGFSTLFFVQIAYVLITASGVMQTFRILGTAFVIIMVILATPLVFPPHGWKPAGWAPSVPKPEAAAKCELKRREMLKTKTFFGLWLCYFIGCLAGLMAISISANVAIEVGGWNALKATLFGFSPVLFLAIFNGAGRPVFGALTDKLTPKNTAILSFVLIIIASLMIWQVQTASIYIISFAILWGCLGGWLAIAPTATAYFFGVGDYLRCYGVIFLAYGAGALVAPFMAGWITEATGSFVNVFPYVVSFAILGILIAHLLMRPVAKDEDDLSTEATKT